MKPTELLTKADLIAVYVRTLVLDEDLPVEIKAALGAIDEKADEVYNILQDEARGDAP